MAQLLLCGHLSYDVLPKTLLRNQSFPMCSITRCQYLALFSFLRFFNIATHIQAYSVTSCIPLLNSLLSDVVILSPKIYALIGKLECRFSVRNDDDR